MKHKIMIINVSVYGETVDSFKLKDLPDDLDTDASVSTIVVLTDGKNSRTLKNREIGFVEVAHVKTANGVCLFDIHSENTKLDDGAKRS